MNKSEALSLAQSANPKVTQVHSTQSIARLWAGMGSIVRVKCNDDITLIVKRIQCQNPTSVGDKRKAASYIVESNFYENYSNLKEFRQNEICCQGLHFSSDKKATTRDNNNDVSINIVMTPLPNTTISYLASDTVLAALRSVASLHAYFWGEKADSAVNEMGLAPQGTYWYLDTRKDEYDSMVRNGGLEGQLKEAAHDIDEALKLHPYQTCVHGDLKSCNMSLSSNKQYVTFVDFQYIGKACCAKDLAYLFVCGMDVDYDDNDDDFPQEEQLLQFYIEQLQNHGVPNNELPEMTQLKKALDLAYCDLYRWMCGWGIWGNGFLEDRVRQCIGTVLD